MKITTTILFVAIAFFSNGQIVHEVEVGGGGAGNPSPYYAPQFITVSVGDTVRWTNVQGSHNVDGRISTFSANPEGFFNGQPSSSWDTFDHVFTLDGVYDYECGQDGHAETQFGTITVGPNSLEEITTIDIYVFPNPVSNELNILTKADINEIQILDVSRNVSMIVDPSNTNGVHIIDISDLTAGIYFVIVKTDKHQGVRRFIKQ